MRIWTSLYHLSPRRSLSSRVTSPTASDVPDLRAGCLLKVEFGSGAIGFSDLHPWVELGDDSLQMQLQKLSQHMLTPLTERSLALAQLDAGARAAGVNVFDRLSVPESHLLLTSLGAQAHVELLRARDRGFESVKIKIGRDLAMEANWLIENAELLDGLRLRLDANATPGLRQIEDFLDHLPFAVIKQIEFIEDPCLYHNVAWAQVARRVPIAFDQARDFDAQLFGSSGDADPARELTLSGVTHLVLKPAVQDPETLLRTALKGDFKIAVTSYLDHPVGQMGAAMVAGQLQEKFSQRGQSDQLADGGLLSQVAYEPNEFTRAWPENQGPDFVAPEGFGIGFDEQLANQTWEELK